MVLLRLFSDETLFTQNPATGKELISELRPVMTLKSSIGVVRHVKKGETVSYGGTWSAKKDSVIGVVPVGYADGYLRQFSNRAQLLYRNRRAPVIGTVCMDYIMIDLSDVVHDGEPRVGEEIVLFGQQQSAELKVTELAQWAGTISYEILTGVSKRIPRVYV